MIFQNRRDGNAKIAGILKDSAGTRFNLGWRGLFDRKETSEMPAPEAGFDSTENRRASANPAWEQVSGLRFYDISTGSISTASVTSSGSLRDSSSFASSRLNALIARVRSRM